MKVSTFIERPVLSAVISITIMVAGIIGLFTLPVEQYPDIAPPTVMVSTTYFGANAETMQKSVVAPLEEAINGVEDMTYMTSTATNSGTATITIYFQQGTDPDMAAASQRIHLSGDVPTPIDPPSGCRFRTRCPYADERCAAEVPEFKEVTSGHWAACHHLDKVK